MACDLFGRRIDDRVRPAGGGPPRFAPLSPRVAVLLVAAIIVGLLLWMARDSVRPFVLGLLLVYLLDIPVRRFVRRGMRRSLAILLVYVVAIVAIVGFLALTLTPLINEIFRLIEQIEGQFLRGSFPEVHLSLLAIHRGQVKSLSQQGRPQSPYESDLLGISVEKGGSGSTAPATSVGVFHGIEASVKYKLGRDDLSGVRVLVQGLGAVGALLATQLAEAGAEVLVSDVKAERVAGSGFEAVDPKDVIGTECDVYAPCAIGGTIDAESIERLRCSVVAGAANNQLADPALADRLHERGILYAPDYVINAGGIVNVSVEFHPGGYDEKVSLGKIERIPQALKELWTIAKEDRIPPSVAADRLAERILGEARGARKAAATMPPKGKRGGG